MDFKYCKCSSSSTVALRSLTNFRSKNMLSNRPESCFPPKYFTPKFIVNLTHFWPMFPSYTPWKHQKTKGFLVFSVGYNGNTSQKWINVFILLVLAGNCFHPHFNKKERAKGNILDAVQGYFKWLLPSVHLFKNSKEKCKVRLKRFIYSCPVDMVSFQGVVHCKIIIYSVTLQD